MNKLNFLGIRLIALLLMVSMAACDSTEPDEGPGDEELITKVTLTLSSAGLSDVVAAATDADGDGADFAIDPIALAANTAYTGTITFEDTVNGEDITAEVRTEADEHQVHYQVAAGLNVTTAATDQDGNGLPLGLSFTLDAGDASAGNLRVVLSHYDDAPKDGTSLSDESDVDLMFMVTIQ